MTVYGIASHGLESVGASLPFAVFEVCSFGQFTRDPIGGMEEKFIPILGVGGAPMRPL